MRQCIFLITLCSFLVACNSEPDRSCVFVGDEENLICPPLEAILPDCDINIRGLANIQAGQKDSIGIARFNVAGRSCNVISDVLENVGEELGKEPDLIDPVVISMLADPHCRKLCTNQLFPDN